MFRSVTTRLIFWIAGTTAVLFSLAILYAYRIARDQALLDAKRRAVLIAQSQAKQVGDALRSAEEGARLLATTLGHTSASNAELEQVIRAFVQGNPRVYGSTIAANPEIRGLYAPYFYRGPNGIARADLAAPSYDYPAKQWYTGAAEAGEPRWSEPYFDEGGGEVVMVTYTVPVFTEGSRMFAGVVTADIALKWLAELIRSQKVEGGGYAMVLSRQGDVLAHPDPGVLATTIDSLRYGKKAIDPRAQEVADRMLRGGNGFEPFVDPYLGETVRAVFQPVGEAGWSIAVIYPEKSLLAGARHIARLNLAMLVAVLGALGLVVAVISKRVTRPLRVLSASATRIATGDLDISLPALASEDEVGALTGAFRHMRDSLKAYIRNLEITTREKERHESELQIAHEIQMSMIHLIFPPFPEHEEFSIYANLSPAREVGGDFYDFLFMDERRLLVCIGDVSDKGVGAALFMAVAKTVIKSQALSERSAAEIVTRANKELSQSNTTCMFVTLFVGVLDIQTGELVYSNGGHNPPLLRRADASIERLSAAHGPMVGVKEDMVYGESRVQMKPNDLLLLYTDGVTEAMNGQGELFSEERLKTLLTDPRSGMCRASVELITASVERFEQGAGQSDDVTVLALSFTGANGDGRGGPEVFSIRNSYEDMPIAEKRLDAVGERHKIPADVLSRFRVILDEILSNIISHAYTDDNQHEIELWMEAVNKRFLLTITDDGRPFNPLSVEPPDTSASMEERELGGVGIHLVRTLADEAIYQRQGEKNVLTLIKEYSD